MGGGGGGREAVGMNINGLNEECKKREMIKIVWSGIVDVLANRCGALEGKSYDEKGLK